jgi:hypothetical protein
MSMSVRTSGDPAGIDWTSSMGQTWFLLGAPMSHVRTGFRDVRTVSKPCPNWPLSSALVEAGEVSLHRMRDSEMTANASKRIDTRKRSGSCLARCRRSAGMQRYASDRVGRLDTAAFELQIRCAERSSVGGFDSRPPPLLASDLTFYVVKRPSWAPLVMSETSCRNTTLDSCRLRHRSASLSDFPSCRRR